MKQFINKQYINVPIDIKFISDWTTLDLNIFKGHSIVNKSITGCGFTHWCLTNDFIPTILCSPRKFLLENKKEQLGNVHLVINNGEKSINFEEDLEYDIKNKSVPDDVITPTTTVDMTEINTLQNDLVQYLLYCQVNNIAPKIMVTYDSFRYMAYCIDKVYNRNDFSVIVDEFQNIFVDAKFKAETELSFVDSLNEFPNVTYLSATPHIEEYLLELEAFRNLPYYEFVWDPSRLRHPHIETKKVSTPYKEIEKIITRYRADNGMTKIVNGMTYKSKEVVFYVNSVRMIGTILVKNNLKPEEVNIICSKDKKNIDKLKKLGYSIGKAPKDGEPHKMFTICTRTVYVGADFYSDNAYSVIVSDCNIESLSVDIRLDLPQIMGRQRKPENVFRDEALLLVKLCDEEITMDLFKQIEQRKLENSQTAIKSIELGMTAAQDAKSYQLLLLRLCIYSLKYKKDYVGINEKTGMPRVNNLVRLSERRSFELRSSTYRNEFNLYSEIVQQQMAVSNTTNQYDAELEYQNFLYKFRTLSFFVDKMKLCCDYLDEIKNHGLLESFDIQKMGVDMCFRNYLSQIPITRIRSLKYQQTNLDQELKALRSGGDIQRFILNDFRVGDRITLANLKEYFKNLYFNLGITTKTPKASDIEEWFVVKKVQITDKVTKKINNGYELLNLK